MKLFAELDLKDKWDVRRIMGGYLYNYLHVNDEDVPYEEIDKYFDGEEASDSIKNYIQKKVTEGYMTVEEYLKSDKFAEYLQDDIYTDSINYIQHEGWLIIKN